MNRLIEIRHINKSDVDYLVRNLRDFEKDKSIKLGLGSAGNVFRSGGRNRLRQRMKSGSRGYTGNLIRSFHVRVKRNKLGVLIGFKQGEDGGSHAHLIDRGTNPRYWKTRKRKYVGRVAPTRFWSDTEAEDYPKAMDSLYIGIEEAVNKLSNRR